MFCLVKLYPSGALRYVRNSLGHVATFSDGRSAKEEAHFRNSCIQEAREGRFKFQPRPYENGNWRKRERDRFATGEYKPVVWAKEPWFKRAKVAKDHFVHVAMSDPDKVSYTESREKGMQDLQVKVRPGAYLKKFFGDVLSEQEIADWAARHGAEYDAYQVGFASEPEEIEHIYRNGPNSCMSRPMGGYVTGLPCHPTRAYGAGDLAVAYLKRRDGRITARALCWPEKKVFGKVYGDGARLKPRLGELGYRRWNGANDFHGARLLKIPAPQVHEQAFVLPYIDGVGWLGHDGDHFYINTNDSVNSAIHPQSDSGFGVFNGRNCDRCSEPVPHGNGIQVVPDEIWCHNCVDDYAFRCPVEDGYHDYSDAIEMVNGELWSENAFSIHGFYCDATGARCPVSECITLETGEHWHQDYFLNHGFTGPDGACWPDQETYERETARQHGQQELASV